MQTVVLNTSGVNVACSTSITRLAYVLSSRFHAGDIFAEGWAPCKIPHLGGTPVRQRMWNPVLDQKPRAWMSSRASEAVLAPLANDSPVISCRTGSTSASWQTTLSVCASRSRSSLWRCIMKPPPPPPPFTNHCMIDIKGLSTDTYIWYTTHLPVIP